VDGGDDEWSGKVKTQLTRADGTPLGTQGLYFFFLGLSFFGNDAGFGYSSRTVAPNL
jgi:hypothetical protein